MVQLLPSGNPETVIVADPDEVETVLQKHFGFGSSECRIALEAGHARAALATDNSAVSQFGSDFYFGIIEEWRNQLALRGFSPKQYRGLELARRQDNRLQVTTCMASDGAGEISGEPRPKNPKGSSSKKAIHDNQGTLGMLTADDRWEPIETWWLLFQVHGHEHSRSITAEVSLPCEMNSGRDFRWSRRLMLPRIELNETADAPTLPAPAEMVQVPIVRRVG